MKADVPVYLFTGFLESGKTKFIRETLEDERFNAGEETLVIMCEEGEEELIPEDIGPEVHLEIIDDERKINPVNLDRLVEKHKAERVMVEYNGMWMLDKFFQAMPENWIIYQEFSFADSRSFLSYNANMRQQVYDKLKSCDCIVFNRWDDSLDKMEFHKIVRAASRRTEIYYEHPNGEADLDEIEDPLPFDKTAPSFEVADSDYALWYRDLDESMDDYEGKVVRVKGIAGNSRMLTGSDFIFGRQLMTCCEADIRMAALACEWKGEKPQIGRWYILEGQLHIKNSKAYGKKKGPVFTVTKLEPCQAPDQPVATFY